VNFVRNLTMKRTFGVTFPVIRKSRLVKVRMESLHSVK